VNGFDNEGSGDSNGDNLGCDDVATLAEDLVHDPSAPPPPAIVSDQPRLVVERPKVIALVRACTSISFLISYNPTFS